MRDHARSGTTRRTTNMQQPSSPATEGARLDPSQPPESDHTGGSSAASQLNRFAVELTSMLQARRITAGKALLEGGEPLLAGLHADRPGAARLLLLVAQWVDVGYRDYHFLEQLLQRFPPECRQRLSLGDYVRLRMVEAFRALSTDEMSDAIEALDLVLKTESDLPDETLATLAHFWKGRAHRKKGEYEAAYLHIVRARELAQKAQDEVFTAVIQIHESWLLFQKGMRREALRLLSHAENVLQATDHYVALGNIESARGRIVRRSGEYTRALEHFERAVSLYAQGDPNHLNLARALVNAAYVRRLLALQLRKKIDARPQSVAGSSANGANLRERYQQICHE